MRQKIVVINVHCQIRASFVLFGQPHFLFLTMGSFWCSLSFQNVESVSLSYQRLKLLDGFMWTHVTKSVQAKSRPWLYSSTVDQDAASTFDCWNLIADFKSKSNIPNATWSDFQITLTLLLQIPYWNADVSISRVLWWVLMIIMYNACDRSLSQDQFLKISCSNTWWGTARSVCFKSVSSNLISAWMSTSFWQWMTNTIFLTLCPYNHFSC